MLGHMQKSQPLWSTNEKNTICQLGRFCPEPFNQKLTFNSEKYKMNAEDLSKMFYCLSLMHNYYTVKKKKSN